LSRVTVLVAASLLLGTLASHTGAEDKAAPTSLKELGDKIKPYKAKMTPSPADWHDQSIYFLFPDRFWNGDPSNDEAGHAWFKLDDPRAAHGGDFKGVTQKLDYLKNLGVTAIWITPVLQNWCAYHGYATCNFLAIEPRLGGLEDLREMVDACHKKGIYVILDIVVNHEADLIYFKDGSTEYKESGHEPGWYAKDKGDKCLPIPTEFQDLNLFHNNGDIDRWDDLDAHPSHAITGDFGGMDDFKTENPIIRDGMVKIYEYLIAQTDVDGFRIDTVKHVDKPFWQTFCPAIHQYAASIGKKSFFLYGEGWMGEDERVAYYTGTKGGGKFLFDGMLHFPMYYGIKAVFEDDAPPTAIADRMRNAKLYQDDGLNVIFLDNHDMDRFLHGKGEQGVQKLEGALGFLYGMRGIPCLYYGTEQGFDGEKDPGCREDMFDNPAWSGNHPGDHFNDQHELYKWVRTLNKLRHDLEPLRRGDLVLRFAEKSGPGLLAFSRVTQRDEILVVVNSSRDQKSARIPLDAGLQGALLVDLTGSKEVVEAAGAGVDVTVPGYGTRIYRRK
jgi:glycosidase